MRNILAALFFCQALVGINSFRFADPAKQEELKNEWKKGLRNSLFDREDDETGIGLGADAGSGGEEGEGEEEGAIKSVVDALQEFVLPSVAKATKVKEEGDEEHAGALVKMLQDGKSYKEVKQEFGKTAIHEHIKCGAVKGYFLHLARESGLFKALKQAIDDDDVDEEELIWQVIEMAEKEDGGILGGILDATKGEFGLHPAMKAVVVIKKLLSHSTCGNPVQEFVKIAAGDMIENIGNLNDSDNPLARLKDKILPFLGLADGASTCKREGLIDNDNSAVQPVSVKKRIARLIFQTNKWKRCRDVPIIVNNLKAVMKGIKVMEKVNVLKKVYFKRIYGMVDKVVKLMTHGADRYAFELVGDQNLVFLREALLIGLTVHKQLELQKPRPTPPLPPRKQADDEPLPEILLRDLELENDLHRMK